MVLVVIVYCSAAMASLSASFGEEDLICREESSLGRDFVIASWIPHNGQLSDDTSSEGDFNSESDEYDYGDESTYTLSDDSTDSDTDDSDLYIPPPFVACSEGNNKHDCTIIICTIATISCQLS